MPPVIKGCSSTLSVILGGETILSTFVLSKSFTTRKKSNTMNIDGLTFQNYAGIIISVVAFVYLCSIVINY